MQYGLKKKKISPKNCISPKQFPSKKIEFWNEKCLGTQMQLVSLIHFFLKILPFPVKVLASW